MAWYNSAKDLGKSVFGGRQDVGILGTGQFKSDQYKVNDKAFNSPDTVQRQKQFTDALRGVSNRSGMQMDTAQGDQWRGRQNTLADALTAQMQGKTPSVAEMQMQRGLNQSVANANSMAASSRGVSPAMAARLAQMTQANSSQDAVGQGGILRAQEQQAAMTQLGQLSSQARNQDLETAQANQQAGMQQRQLNDQQDRFYREGQMTMDERQRQGQIERERVKSQNALGYNQINSGAYQAAAQNRAGVIGGIASGIAGMAGGAASIFSDENLKTGIEKISFDSPADSSFKPTLAAGPEEDHFEPTVDAANAKRKEDTRKYLESTKDDKGSNFQKMGQGLGALGMALSDENEKKDKSGGEGKVKGFLDALQAYTYKYKNPEHGEGQQLGVMAQDLEKTPIGKSMVVDTPEGKMVDYGKAGGVMLANQAMLHDRLSQLEKAFQSRKKRSA